MIGNSPQAAEGVGARDPPKNGSGTDGAATRRKAAARTRAPGA
jgi:hypothetical protein